MLNVDAHEIDLHSLNRPNDSNDYSCTDISDETQFYFELGMNFNNIDKENVNIALRDKYSNRAIKKVKLADKNILKFKDSKNRMKLLQNLNEKYELVWSIKGNNRKGIIHFDYPIAYRVSLLEPVPRRDN